MTDNKTNINNNILEGFIGKKETLIEENKLEAAKLIEKIDTINTRKAYQKVSHRIEKKTPVYNLYRQLIKIAAVLFIPLLFVSIWLFFNDDKINQIETTQYTVNCPVGTKTQLVLPDGSLVWLNAGTELKYNLPFERKIRNIKLDGEAYFIVEKSEVPFVVQAENTAVQVYGTAFNVKSYANDHQIEVALQEGSIGFSVADEEKSVQLIPNDYLVFNKTDGSITKTNKNIGKHIAWRQNLLIFDETPLVEMALTLERWYGIEVEIKDNDLLKYKFTATFENESLLQVIELLELSSPIKIDYKPTKLDEHSNIINKAKIIIHKKM